MIIRTNRFVVIKLDDSVTKLPAHSTDCRGPRQFDLFTSRIRVFAARRGPTSLRAAFARWRTANKEPAPCCEGFRAFTFEVEKLIFLKEYLDGEFTRFFPRQAVRTGALQFSEFGRYDGLHIRSERLHGLMHFRFNKAACKLESLADFAARLPEHQNELWKRGIGVGRPREAFGPIDWGWSLDGTLKLADLSGVTTEFSRVQACCAAETQAKRAASLTRKFLNIGIDPTIARAATASYAERISAELNAERLENLWRSGAETGRSSTFADQSVTTHDHRRGVAHVSRAATGEWTRFLYRHGERADYNQQDQTDDHRNAHGDPDPGPDPLAPHSHGPAKVD